jgi:hypothetical protein
LLRDLAREKLVYHLIITHNFARSRHSRIAYRCCVGGKLVGEGKVADLTAAADGGDDDRQPRFTWTASPATLAFTSQRTRSRPTQYQCRRRVIIVENLHVNDDAGLDAANGQLSLAVRPA